MGLRVLIAAGAVFGLTAISPALSAGQDPVLVQEIEGKCLAVEGETRLLVKVRGLGAAEGNIRIQAYSSDPDEFLEKGTKLLRLEVKAEEDRDICVPMPGPGKYAMVLMHDRNANGKADIFSEGFGFSRNPELGLSKPDHDEVVVEVPAGVSSQTIQVKYVFGDGGAAQKKRRRTRRR